MKLLIFLSFAKLFTKSYAEEISAIVELIPDPRFSNLMVHGRIKITQNHPNDSVKFSGVVRNLSEASSHGFHVHTNGKLEPDCDAAGPHFNPTNQHHGGPEDNIRHVGDLGNIRSNDDGVAEVDIIDRKMSLFKNATNNIIGRTLVVHANKDDLGKGNSKLSLETGNSGGRIACGIIRLLH